MNAPIIVFAYNRPQHLKKTLTALACNDGAEESDLFIFIDGPKSDAGLEKNTEVYEIAKEFEHGFFKNVVISNSKKNKGLAASVIAGVSRIIEQYGKAIITEDDAVSSPGYLDFMNGALEFYENNLKIWSIGGYTVPMRLPEDYRADVIMTQRSSSYAWATWKDRWDKIDWDMRDYRRFRFDFVARAKFNRWGNDRASMLDDQMNGRVNSWAIRFDYAMFKNNMYNIVPRESLIQNIGHDGSGTHSRTDESGNDRFMTELRMEDQSFNYADVEINEEIRREFTQPFYSTPKSLTRRYLSNLCWSIRKGK